MKIHQSITPDRVTETIEQSQVLLDSPGFCIACGEEAEGVEPDACRYSCDSCGQPGVYGAEQLLILLA